MSTASSVLTYQEPAKVFGVGGLGLNEACECDILVAMAASHGAIHEGVGSWDKPFWAAPCRPSLYAIDGRIC